jgi:predicted P-loop ATPase
MLVLEGPQGFLKSTALRTLAEPWFSDDLGEFGNKDTSLQLTGIWVMELSELDSYNRSDVARTKSFMTRTDDHFRPPYGTHVIDLPRQTIFGGTVNHNEYLKDETGNRRFWPGACSKIDIDGLGQDRDQLWAEARDRFLADEHWWLDDPKLIAAATDEQARRYQLDVWDAVIDEYLVGRTDVSVQEILKGAIGLQEKADWKQPEQNRVARCLRSLGWVRKYAGGRGNREWRYVRP